ncbi:astacin-like metalloprotease toxin 5 [Folsomia candida]|uniref:Metalloendopeptidase n=1 Tax=Folsomia candida TaxID=158441 RepID=A0A226DFC7_FOLCA|nr:astacin-like metalloprotease toxin 5 [Folsomia candida]OXA44285.1 Astacin-like metalloprotease toxin 1 [Folsomia candida]
MNALWVFTIVVLSFVGPVLGTGPILFTELNYSIPNGYRRLDDMILPETFFHPNSTRNAVNSADLIWPKGRIPYVIDNSLSQHSQRIYNAMGDYHSKTCIRFVPRTNEYNYVNIFSGQGCYSLIGLAKQGQQPLSLGNGCLDHGTIVHELGHAAGFFHEQNRSDRDNHLIINWANIQQGYASQFYKLDPSQNWLINGFDVSSIMLYGELSFSKDGYSRTMTNRGGQKLLEVYQKRGLSYADVQRVNKLYGC